MNFPPAPHSSEQRNIMIEEDKELLNEHFVSELSNLTGYLQETTQKLADLKSDNLMASSNSLTMANVEDLKQLRYALQELKT